jgi:hypothetical protein
MPLAIILALVPSGVEIMLAWSGFLVHTRKVQQLHYDVVPVMVSWFRLLVDSTTRRQ